VGEVVRQRDGMYEAILMYGVLGLRKLRPEEYTIVHVDDVDYVSIHADEDRAGEDLKHDVLDDVLVDDHVVRDARDARDVRDERRHDP
jgi:hypothetical protein